MTGWQKLWQDPETARQWQEFPPLPEVETMADLLLAAGGGRVLDIGCGMGRHTAYLAARGLEVTATDNAAAAIAGCRRNLEAAGLQAELLQIEMTDFPFPDGHFQGVVAAHVIHHTDAAALAGIIEAVTRKLAPGGLFVWATPTPRHARCGKGREIEPGTWIDEEHAENIPHHYCTEDEVRLLLRGYDILSLVEHERRVDDETYWHWRVLGRKR